MKIVTHLKKKLTTNPQINRIRNVGKIAFSHLFFIIWIAAAPSGLWKNQELSPHNTTPTIKTSWRTSVKLTRILFLQKLSKNSLYSDNPSTKPTYAITSFFLSPCCSCCCTTIGLKAQNFWGTAQPNVRPRVWETEEEPVPGVCHSALGCPDVPAQGLRWGPGHFS